MDKFTKSVLALIAVGIIGINIQMMNSGGGFFSKAHASSTVQKVVICDRSGFSCAQVFGPSLSVTD
tara:strand:- start:1045 stop:1242 length:198 start_codon:yes stop_codon:yes gene_type:complete